MNFKVVYILSLFVLLDLTFAFRTNYSNADPKLGVYAPMAHCSVAHCSLPCRGAAPPPSCPDTLPQCASGCACMADCEQQAIVCFETKHCVQRKKYYARTIKHRTV